MRSRTASEQVHEHGLDQAEGTDHDESGDRDEKSLGPTWKAAQQRAADEEVGHHHGKTSGQRDSLKSGSARFENDPEVEDVRTGGATYAEGSTGRAITKMQSALIDLGYLLPKHGVDGDFGPETKKALLAFQKDAKVPETGVFDKATIDELHKRFDTRKPYIDNADNDSSHHGLRDLENYEKKQALDAMLPRRGAGAIFEEEVSGKKYGDRIQARLTKVIARLHKELYADKVGKRADPDKNFHEWSTLEGPAEAAKDATDDLYGDFATAPAMTFADGSLVDQWEDEVARNAALDTGEQTDKAKGKVNYLINANCSDINEEHNASTGGSRERAILDPIVDSFTDTDAKVQKMLQIEMGWEGAQLDGQVYIQRYQEGTDDANRQQLWSLFHTCIHEYIHKLRHDDYDAFADSLDGARSHTLIEGFCDFFTLNVRADLGIDEPMQKKVEGPYFKSGQAPPSNADGKSSGVYSSHQQAEQVVSIVGIRNAQAAYFLGEVERIGDK